MRKKSQNRPIKHANRLTRFWQDYGPNTYPLDIDLLIEGAIQSSGYNACLETKRGSFDSFEGCLLRVAKTDRWNILINENITNQRRLRFTHAHELGHFMCHREQQNRFEDSPDTLNDFQQELEAEANTFASWLLMPANVVRDEFDRSSWTVDTLRKLGNRFECSLQASGLRFADIASKPIAFVVSRDGMILWAKKSPSAPYMKAFCSGDELPSDSEAGKLSASSSRHSDDVDSGHAWNEYRRSAESQYFDQTGRGYQYTCIEFEE
ncbi:ImmA/IrrE family metallo-endopeptidase [Parasphingopyxis lamellibrachiae]|uniref:Uncharacterized protein DUF955 n=1 Tax=Parasphingopyxis lamellibrachiae TaxID=680125 RepID=A0A3D9FGE2_9SPHN|nr:ImmA/IrrE family metallo-endopeptidase [Parasphingopyxis lamellibrachiae]RED16718.1 uncharacterized protein DUF955 [Parasphingopyxis lamellibrachiae]